jgi:hypothetical protein
LFPFGLFITKETTMKKTIRLTESDLMRIVKRVINERYPDDLNAWASRDFSPGSPTYDRDMEEHRKGMERDRQSAIQDRKNLVIPMYELGTGKAWNVGSLSQWVLRKYDIEIPEEYMDNINSIRKYVRSLVKSDM